jgi:hypothetical protein
MKDSSSAPTHRRLGSRPGGNLSFALEDGPTTTSKALLVSVTAPCKFLHSADDDDTTTIGGNASPQPSPTAKEKGSSSLTDINDAEEEANSPAAAAAMATAEAENAKKEEAPADTGKEAAESGQEELICLEPPEDSIPEHEDLILMSESQEITHEEAAAVQVGKNPEEGAEINVAELLRICFQTLLEEYHLLNVPTYSNIEDKKIINVPIGSEESEEKNSEKTSWIQVEAMCRPSSLGIILERLERIGIGSNVGSVSIFKAELCRTASPYMTIPEKEEDQIPEHVQSAAATATTSEKEEATKGFDASTASSASGAITTKQESMSDEDAERIKAERMLEEARAEWKNAATRLRFEQVREQIAEQAALSFDFISLLCIASILAGIGLITDNSVVIVASMLVSPMYVSVGSSSVFCLARHYISKPFSPSLFSFLFPTPAWDLV